MPKMKTHKTAAKRFKITGRGKLRRRKARATHLRRRKSKRSKRELRQDVPVSSADQKRVRRLLGIGKS
jgi:large subunit ribosomal protein L35